MTVVRVGPEELNESAKAPGFCWPRWLPWPFLALFLGVVLAAGAAGLMYMQDPLLGGLALVLAIGALLAGLVGLARSHAEEQRRCELEPAPTILRIHNQTACAIDRPLIDKLARAADTVKQQLQQRGWEADWAKYAQHADLAGKLLEQNDLPGTFRAWCLATCELLEAWRRQRQKDDILQDVWEKHPSANSNHAAGAPMQEPPKDQPKPEG